MIKKIKIKEQESSGVQWIIRAYAKGSDSVAFEMPLRKISATELQNILHTDPYFGARGLTITHITYFKQSIRKRDQSRIDMARFDYYLDGNIYPRPTITPEEGKVLAEKS